jgi:hypothetical protein
MTLYQFKLLEKEGQIDLVNTYAVPIAERVEGNYTYKLLQLDTFYIEEEWHTVFNERRSFIAFISEERLQPYLQSIDLSSLHLPITKSNK